MPREANARFKLATRYDQPDICRFLLSHNADVNVFGRHVPGSEEEAILTTSSSNQWEASKEVLDRMLECKGLLLDAGADPTDYTSYAGSGFTTAFQDNCVVGQSSIKELPLQYYTKMLISL